ncbi:hypothetical protein T265_04283 [Opisthorchis viverrini]|uniref:Major facilitator superfamily associated domain-containing protein n=2 Tax=Opisthorchis viverrini TaxID=6198 RepID=A0A074ZT26_OPIVI|nr:hypothetical protein T265_04283 [Opisthorchis viverrini]KER28987.1 hypothetical protein T265_04283 [Opisthorchis viverrini]
MQPTQNMFVVFGSFGVYLNPLLSSYGLTSMQIGVVSFISNGVATFSRIIFGIIADRTRKYHRVLFWLTIISAVVVLSFGFLPRSWNAFYEGRIYSDGTFISKWIRNEDGDPKRSFVTCWPTYLRQCFSNVTTMVNPVNFVLGRADATSNQAFYLAETSSMIMKSQSSTGQNIPVNVICSVIGPNHDHLCHEPRNKIPAIATTTTFLIALLMRSIFNGLFMPTTNLLDSVTHAALGERDAHLYGRSRVFASLGYAVSVTVTGFLISHYTASSRPSSSFPTVVEPSQDYLPAIMLGSAFALAAALFGGMTQVSVGANELEITHVLKLAFRSELMLRCIVTSFFSGILLSFSNDYAFLILTKHLGLPPYFLGILTTVNILSAEIPGFLLSNAVLTYLGDNWCLSLAFLLVALQNLVVAFTRNYWWLLFSSSFLGCWFPLMYHTLLDQATRAGRTDHAKADIVASMHGIMNAVLVGISASFGGLFWGVLLEFFSGIQLFFIVSGMAFVLTLLVPLFCSMISRFGIVSEKLNFTM